MKKLSKFLAQALGFLIACVIGFGLAPWVFKGIVLLETNVFPWYFNYFSRVMGIK